MNTIDRDKKIHSLRLEVKRLRAKVRLLKAIRLPHAHHLNKNLRAVSRTLSPYRDAAVCAKWLRKHGLPVQNEKNLKSPPMAALETKVRELSLEMETYAPKKMKISQLKKALRRTTRKVEKAKKIASENPEDAHFHAWRKRSKDLLFQLEFLGVRKKTRKLTELTKTLGRAQDSALIEQKKLPLPIQKRAQDRVQRETKIAQPSLGALTHEPVF